MEHTKIKTRTKEKEINESLFLNESFLLQDLKMKIRHVINAHYDKVSLSINNLKSSFFAMIFGVIFGIYSILTIVANGYVLGFVSAEAVKFEGVLTLLNLLPHGIFELPAIFLSVGLGIKLGSFIFREKKKTVFKDYLLNSLRVFLLIIIPLLIIAAVIEGSLISFLR